MDSSATLFKHLEEKQVLFTIVILIGLTPSTPIKEEVGTQEKVIKIPQSPEKSRVKLEFFWCVES